MFMEMLTAGSAGFPRDLLLPLPVAGWEAVVPKLAEHADASAMARSVLDGLRRPVSVKKKGSFALGLGALSVAAMWAGRCLYGTFGTEVHSVPYVVAAWREQGRYRRDRQLVAAAQQGLRRHDWLRGGSYSGRSHLGSLADCSSLS